MAATTMKFSKSETHSKSFATPVYRFEDQQLTLFAGLPLFRQLFKKLGLDQRLKRCFERRKSQSIYGFHSIALLLIVHILLGYRRLNDLKFYQNDPMVHHVTGLKKLPDPSTVSRHLNLIDEKSIHNLRSEMSSQVLSNLKQIRNLKALTLDFDGSVIATSRYAEGTAVGYNKKK